MSRLGRGLILVGMLLLSRPMRTALLATSLVGLAVLAWWLCTSGQRAAVPLSLRSNLAQLSVVSVTAAAALGVCFAPAKAHRRELRNLTQPFATL
jgi:hypothetical protein